MHTDFINQILLLLSDFVLFLNNGSLCLNQEIILISAS